MLYGLRHSSLRVRALETLHSLVLIIRTSGIHSEGQPLLTKSPRKFWDPGLSAVRRFTVCHTAAEGHVPLKHYTAWP